MLPRVKWKWIRDLNVKRKTVKLLDDNTGKILDDPKSGDDFLDIITRTQSMREIINKLDFIIIGNLL